MLFANEVLEQAALWERIIDKYGLPTFYLFITLAVLYYVARWLRDKVFTPLVDSTVRLHETLGKNNDENTKSLKEVSDSVQTLAEKQSGIMDQIQANGTDMVKAVERQTVSLLEHLKPSSNGKHSEVSKEDAPK